MRAISGMLVAALLAGASPVLAQAQPASAPSVSDAVKPGAKVLDPKGGEVGTVESVSAGTAIVDTGSHKVALPFASFAVGQNGPVIGMTKADLDDAVTKQQAQTAASVAAGMKVSGAAGTPLGTIESVDAQFALLDTGKGRVKLPLSAFAKGQDGLVIGLTADQLAAAVQAAGGSPGAAQ